MNKGKDNLEIAKSYSETFSAIFDEMKKESGFSIASYAVGVFVARYVAKQALYVCQDEMEFCDDFSRLIKSMASKTNLFEESSNDR